MFVGFRPKHRAQDAIAEIHYLGSPTRNYEWIFEGDIEACFDTIDHTALIARVQNRIVDKGVLRLVKAFLKAGVLAEDGSRHRTITGTPQVGILSPLLANIVLSVLDEHFTPEIGERSDRNEHVSSVAVAGNPSCASSATQHDFVVMVGGTRTDAEALRDEVSGVLAPMGLRLSVDKTRVCHIDEGFELVGLAYPTSGLAEPNRQAGRIHLPIEEVTGFYREQGATAYTPQTSSNALRPVAPTEPGAARLVQLLTSRSLEKNLRLRRPLRLLACRRVAEETTPRTEHAHPRPSLPPQMGDQRRGDRPVPTQTVRRREIPLPGHQNHSYWNCSSLWGLPVMMGVAPWTGGRV